MHALSEITILPLHQLESYQKRAIGIMHGKKYGNLESLKNHALE